MTYIPPAQAALFRSAAGEGLNLGVFFHLATTPPLRLWMGTSDVRPGINTVDTGAGAEYAGAGRLLDIPALEILINGVADQVEFKVSGLTLNDVDVIDAAAPDVTAKDVYVGVAPLDSLYQLQTPILWLWTGQADYWAERKVPASGLDSPTYSISLVCGVGDQDRSRQRKVAWTDAFQRLISATDEFCSRVARYVAGVVVTWPRW